MDKKGIAADDFIPLMVVIFIVVIAILFLSISGAVKEKKINDGIDKIDTNLEMIRSLNDFLNKEVVFNGTSLRIVDWVAVLNDEEDEKTKFLEGEAKKFFDKIMKTWWFEVWLDEERILWKGETYKLGKKVTTIKGCYQEKEYKIDLPQGKVIFCY